MPSSALIGIAGPSCSGKTERARALAARLGCPMLNLDLYYYDLSHLPPDERAKTNFDEPAILEFPLILQHAQALQRGESILAPRYDFTTHTRPPGGIEVRPTAFVVLEGLFALHWPELRQLYTLSVYVDTPDEICFNRRFHRDQIERGRSPESIRRQYDHWVRPMAQKWILPTRQFAHLTVSGAEDIPAAIEQITGRIMAAL
jgi:uridine kinase